MMAPIAPFACTVRHGHKGSQGQAPPERCERGGMNPLNPKPCKHGGGVREAWHKRFLRGKLHLNAASAAV